MNGSKGGMRGWRRGEGESVRREEEEKNRDRIGAKRAKLSRTDSCWLGEAVAEGEELT